MYFVKRQGTARIALANHLLLKGIRLFFFFLNKLIHKAFVGASGRLADKQVESILVCENVLHQYGNNLIRNIPHIFRMAICQRSEASFSAFAIQIQHMIRNW